MKQQGMILVTTLLVLLIMSLGLFLQLQIIFLHSQIYHQASSKILLINNLESIANALILHWHGQACEQCLVHDANFTYVYTIKVLGDSHCLKINPGGQSTRHGVLRIAHKDIPQQKLQIHMVVPIGVGTCDSGVVRYISKQTLSWLLR